MGLCLYDRIDTNLVTMGDRIQYGECVCVPDPFGRPYLDVIYLLESAVISLLK